MTSYGRADHQWRNPSGTGLEDVQEESMSEVSFDQQAPAHPIDTMQGAFEESMQETLADAEESALAKKDAVYRRKVLLERATYTRMVAGKWMQKKGEKYHPLWKITAQLSFGMHLLHQELAKSDEEVIKILQGHVDEVDGFLERTTEDFELAQHDINERIRYLQLPLEHEEVFDTMLMDRSFRTAMVDGNVKIEHIVERTAISLQDSLKDVKKGADGARELARYLRRLEKTWHGRDAAITEVFQAMMGNTEGWAHAYSDLQETGKVLAKSLEHLRAIIAEIQRLVGIASRRDVPQAYGHSREGSLSRPMSPQQSRTPDPMDSLVDTDRSPPQQDRGDYDIEPESQRPRNRTPPALHPNAIIEEEDESEYSPPRNQTSITNHDKSNPITDAPKYESGAATVISTTGLAAGLGAIAGTSLTHAEETGRMTPMAFSRSVKVPHPDVIQEETEEEYEEDDGDSVESDYTIDIVEATPITAMAVGRDMPPHAPRMDSLPRPDTTKSGFTPDYTTPNFEFGSSIATENDNSTKAKDFVLPPLDIGDEAPLPMLTPLDYEKMKAIQTPDAFDLKPPNEHADQKSPEVEQSKTSPYPFQQNDNSKNVSSAEESSKTEAQLSETNIPLAAAAAAAAAATALVMERTRAYEAEEISPSVYTPAPWSPEDIVDHSIPLPTSSHYDLTRRDNHVPNMNQTQHIPEADPSSIESHNEPVQTVMREDAKGTPATTSTEQNLPQIGQIASEPINSKIEPAQDIEEEYTEDEEDEEEPVIILPPANLRALTTAQQQVEQSQNVADRNNITNAKAIAGGAVVSAAVGDLTTSASAIPSTGNRGLGNPDTPFLSKQPRQLPINDLLSRLRHGNGLVTPTSPLPPGTAAYSDSLPTSPLQQNATESNQEASVPSAPMVLPTVIISPSEDVFPPPQPSVAEVDPVVNQPQVEPMSKAERRPANLPLDTVKSSEAPINSQKLEEIMQRRPAVVIPRLQRRSSYSDNRITQRLSHLAQAGLQASLLSPDNANGFSKQYPNSAVVPGSGPWTYFSKEDMDHSYRHRRAHSLFSLASPYDLEWLLRRTPSDAAVSPMRWSDFYDFRSRGNSIVSPLVSTPFGLGSAPFALPKKDNTVDSLLQSNKNYSAPVTPLKEENTGGGENGFAPNESLPINTVSANATASEIPIAAQITSDATTRSAPLQRDIETDIASTSAVPQSTSSAAAQAEVPKRKPLKPLNDQPLRPNSLLLDLAKARGQLAQAADIKPIQAAHKEPTPREPKPDRSQARASSIYSKAPDFSSMVSSPPPDVPAISRSETGYTSQYDENSPPPSSTYTDLTFGQISPPPDVSSAKPSPLHFAPKARIPSEPSSPASPKEEPKYAVEISDEKHTVIEVPPISPSLASLTSATITGPEPDFPFLSGTWGGPEVDYYYPPSREEGQSPKKHAESPAAAAVQQNFEPSRAASPLAQTTNFEPQQPISAPYYPPQDTSTPPIQNTATFTATQDSTPRRDAPPALSLKLFPSTDQIPRGASPRSPRPQDLAAENGRPLMPLSNASISNSNLLALPPLTQEPLSPPVAVKRQSSSPFKKLFKSALSPGIFSGKLKRGKTKGHQRNHSGQSLAREVTVANAQQNAGGAPAPIVHGRVTNGSIDTTNSVRSGSLTGYDEERRPSGERVLYGLPGSDGRPF